MRRQAAVPINPPQVQSEPLIGQEQYPEPAYNPPGVRFEELRNRITELLETSKTASNAEMHDVYCELNIKCIRLARVCVQLW